MARTSILSNTSFILFLLAIASINISCYAQSEDRKVYIVYMGELPTESTYTPMSHHQNILQDILEGSSVQDTLVHSYKRSFNGFSAKLTEKEVQKLSGMEGIVSIFPNRIYELQTTRSWDFVGLPENVKRMPTVESDTIVGVIDSGIWPESEMFSDYGFGPPPMKWKGVCDGGHNLTCNNKLIGARYYESVLTTEGSARDTQGHGTHTASTAAGNIVKGVSFYEIANGNARGAVPSARIAAYKVCFSDGCASNAILAGFDDAIADGVDIISVSLGSDPVGFDFDPVAIGSFHAMQKGILTSHSVGNNGPDLQTVGSNAPWLLSVAASSTDRQVMDKIVLGNGKTFQGLGVNGFMLKGTQFPLLYGDNVSTICDTLAAKHCEEGCLDKELVKGKIVICDSAKADSETFTSGALGTILVSDPSQAWFDMSPPDISAPGVDILAAFSPAANPSSVTGDTRSVKYSILSGTSMACPHVTGAAAYVKTYHPDWSPSAIKSALMTTAFSMNNTKYSDAEFAYGSGQIDPVKALNPGLVYDAHADDYVQFLCGMGYDSSKVKLITNSTCPGGRTTPDQSKNLNYPSFGAHVEVGKKINLKFARTVTNVGTTSSTYKVKITSDDRITVAVEPQVLSFKSFNEEQSFVVSVAGDGLGLDEMATASLVWSDEVHIVRSPIVLTMATTSSLLTPFLIAFIAIASFNVSCYAQSEDKKVYIVYMGDLPTDGEYTPMSHTKIFFKIFSMEVQDTLVHSNKRSFNGFSAKLTEKEVQKLSGVDGIVSIFPNRIYQLQTTRSWDFIGLPENVQRMPTVEIDTIIGLLDTGIWPESESFSDVGFGPPSKKWKGVCDGGHNFTCNNKLIGARYYDPTPGKNESARDTQGHGTHTASTAAGNIVKGAGFYEIAKGNARRAVRSARIAAYKVCFANGCESDAILAGFDDAISDGVDILSVSLGGSDPDSFDTDPVAIGSFHAMKKGVLTSQSAGNSGPGSQTVSSNAPWLLTVAASSIDRRVIDKIVLGNGQTIQQRCLDEDLVKGKIVICNSPRASEPFIKGALGTILVSDPSHATFDASSVYPLPAALINSTNGNLVKSYFKSTRNPVATILGTESIKDFEAPVVASFSSRGPNKISPDIIKPDISAPGVNILAAYSPVASPSDTGYKVCSYDTAFAMNNTKNSDAEFAYGSGQIDPVKALSPGLVYDAYADDYVQYICGMGYDASTFKLITNSTCSSRRATTDQSRNLNYPSCGAHVEVGKKINLKFTRTVSNVGTTNSTYKVKITSDSRIMVAVEPEVLSFKSLNEKKSFVVTVVGDAFGPDEMATASLVWSDEVHIVRSPIVVYSQSIGKL
ncbi:hypothetical protein C5167_025939 [Papaver somniferum]|uniref:Cucumisin n=1 Tax=Papaver somniferum TaxID=3469 RepID=A0A4Y7JWS0_PAPSO|nr:hypothetical protein C5167_025939 [Papaver somniferum]